MICQDPASFEIGYKQAMETADRFYKSEIRRLNDEIEHYKIRYNLINQQLEQQEQNEKYIKLGKALLVILEELKHE
jgi:hypothetical protein